MKLLYSINVIILAIFIVACERDNMIGRTNCIFSHCESNVDSKNSESKSKDSVNLKKQIANYKLECRGETDGTGEYILVMVVDEKAKGLLRIVTGIPFWGEPYDQKTRCEETKTRVFAGIEAGADGLSSAYKNGYPVICSSFKGRCLKDPNEEIMEIIMFRKGVNAEAIAKKLTNRFNDKASPYDDLVSF